MADQIWSKNTFAEGYSTGSITDLYDENKEERDLALLEEKKLGGSVSDFIANAVKPLLKPDDCVLELGPGKGSFTRGLFTMITKGQIHTIDLQDIRPWVQDLITKFEDRFFMHQVEIGDFEYNFLEDDFFDTFFSFGVFCHMNLTDIERFLLKLRQKLKKDAICIAQYSDWQKAGNYCLDPEGQSYNLEAYNMLTTEYPFEFKYLQAKTIRQKIPLLIDKYLLNKYPKPQIPPEQSFWVKNDQKSMQRLLRKTGYQVLEIDTGHFQRDSVAVFKLLS
jgi:phospholipid N-methyltransferase